MSNTRIVLTRSSADADNGLDAFSGQSRSTNGGQRSLKVIESGIIR